MTTTKPTSRKRAAILIKAALQALDEAGGNLPRSEVFREIEKRVELTAEDRAVYAKTGHVRWHSVVHFYSIDCVKAGLIKKAGGRWWLTPEGKELLASSADDIIDRAIKGYREWKAQRGPRAEDLAHRSEPEIAADEPGPPERSLVFESAEAQAVLEIEGHVERLGPYEFQDVVAALLRGMGYSTPFVAPKGPDGGTDIVAYRDPLGVDRPHVRVQVKHRKDSKATREEIAALRGIIRQDREVGLFVSTAGFTNDAQREARQGGVHIELIDLDRFLELWTAYYDKLAEEDKGYLRLRKVHFLSPEE